MRYRARLRRPPRAAAASEPGTTRTTGRAITALSTNSPRALSSERNTTQRETSSRVVVAVSLSDGTRNCGGGPGFGPYGEGEGAAHRVPVRRDHAPEDEVPALGHAANGVISVCGDPGALCGGPDVTCVADASVTETIAKRASIGSV